MILVDSRLRELETAGTPIRVGVVGAGFAGRGLVHQIEHVTPGMRVVVVCNRTIAEAAHAYTDFVASPPEVVAVDAPAVLSARIARGAASITDDPFLVTRCPEVDVIVEATGEIAFGAEVVADAIAHGKHVVLLNAELDATLGPILKHRADRAGVMFSDADGDQPGVIMNLAREATMLGFTPVVLGNIKSLLDHRRTPTTQEAFARNVFQRPKMITSFADGTKISAEMACVANASGFGVSVAGMEGPRCARVEEAASLFPVEQLFEKGEGLTDYILGAEPSFGVFVLAVSTSPLHERYMRIYKMGDGPVYTFYRPYHLSPLETPLTIARAALFRDASVAPLGGPVCDVVTVAKFDLKAGTILDAVGGYHSYGDIENSGHARGSNLLPIGLSDGARLLRDVAADTPLTFADVEIPKGRLCDELWREQCEVFPTA